MIVSNQLTPQEYSSSSSNRRWVWIAVFLFLCGLGLGIWGTQRWMTHHPAPEKQFDSRSSVMAGVSSTPSGTEDLEKGEPTQLAPKLYLGPNQRTGLTDAVLLNGGGQAESNYFSHHLHIRMIHEALQKRGVSSQKIKIFSSDGEDTAPDQMLLEPLQHGWLWQGLPEWQILDPAKLINTALAGATLLPAKKVTIQKQMRALAQRIQKRKSPSTVLLFVTDHGTKGKGPWGNHIELWHEKLNVAELRDMLEEFPAQTRVVSVMSQCYSGGFANLLYRRSWQVHGNRCGFFSTVANREAYGCFPETAKQNRVGHAYRWIRGMRWAQTYDQVHRHVLTEDLTPDVPIATSDIYLEDLMRRQARKQKSTLTKIVDAKLRQIWRKPHATLRDEIQLLRRIEKRFYLPSYQYLHEVWRDLKQHRQEIKTFKQHDETWQQVWKEIQRGAVMAFYQKNPQVGQSVEAELNRPDMDAQTKETGRQLYDAYWAYLQKNPAIEQRLRRLHQRHQQVMKKVHLMYVHEAALLRVSQRLKRIVGLEYLRRSGSRVQRTHLINLTRCETTAIGGQPFRSVLRAEGDVQESTQPRMLAKISRKSLMPAWLGIGFQPATPGWNARFEKMAPGAVEVINVADSSPASRGGLQTGDIVVAVGGKMLQLDNEIREIVMLSSVEKDTFFLVARQSRILTIKIRLQPQQPSQMLAAVPPSTQEPHTFDPPNPGDPGQPHIVIPPHQHDDSMPSQPPTTPFVEPDTDVYGLPPSNNPPQPRQRTSPAKRLNMTTVDGKSIQFPAKRGPSLAFFWATWCEGCKAMVPMIKKLQSRYQGRGLSVFAVTTDTPALLKPFLRQWGRRFPFRVAIDNGNVLGRQYRIDAIPQLMIFRPNGTVALHVRRFQEDSFTQIESAIRKLLP